LFCKKKKEKRKKEIDLFI